jgi:hypothetical protein
VTTLRERLKLPAIPGCELATCAACGAHTYGKPDADGRVPCWACASRAKAAPAPAPSETRLKLADARRSARDSYARLEALVPSRVERSK